MSARGDDARHALTELRARTGLADTWVVGTRLGGSMAMSAAERDSEVRGVVLWDPVVNGDAYWLEQKQLHRQMMRRSHVLKGHPVSHDDGDENLGYSWPDRLVRELQSISPADVPRMPARKVLVIESRPDTNLEPLVERPTEWISSDNTKRCGQ